MDKESWGLLQRIDERTQQLFDKTNEIKKDLSIFKKQLEQDYVRREEFEPVKKIAYGLVGAVLIAVIGSLTKLVLMTP